MLAIRRILAFPLAAWRARCAPRERVPEQSSLLHIAAIMATRPCECQGDCDTCAPCLSRRELGIDTEPPPEACRLCLRPLTAEEVVICSPCLEETTDELVRKRIAELDADEALGFARGVAIRTGEKELAAALHAVLLLHLVGANLKPVVALVQPEPLREAVN